MPILGVIFTLVIIGVVMWLVNTYIPMEGNIKNVLNILVLILVVIWVISIFIPLGSLLGQGAYLPRYGR